jgi:hypothetical protein
MSKTDNTAVELIAQLNATWRVTFDGAWFILERLWRPARKTVQHVAVWRASRRCKTRFALERCIKTYVVGPVDPAALAIVGELAGHVDWIGKTIAPPEPPRPPPKYPRKSRRKAVTDLARSAQPIEPVQHAPSKRWQNKRRLAPRCKAVEAAPIEPPTPPAPPPRPIEPAPKKRSPRIAALAAQFITYRRRCRGDAWASRSGLMLLK